MVAILAPERVNGSITGILEIGSGNGLLVLNNKTIMLLIGRPAPATLTMHIISLCCEVVK